MSENPIPKTITGWRPSVTAGALPLNLAIEKLRLSLGEINSTGKMNTAGIMALNPAIEKLRLSLGEINSTGKMNTAGIMALNPAIEKLRLSLGDLPGGMNTAARFSSLAKVWAPALKSGPSFLAAAVEFQVSNPTAASALAAVAGQRVAASGRANTVGSFDDQFSAVVRHLEPEHVPLQLQQQLSAPMEDPQTAQTVAATVGLSAVPASKFERMLLALLLGFTAMMLYGFVQHGMVGGPVSPQLGVESVLAGAGTFKSVRWAEDARVKLQKK